MSKLFTNQHARAHHSRAGVVAVFGLFGILLVLASYSGPMASVEAAGKGEARTTRNLRAEPVAQTALVADSASFEYSVTVSDGGEGSTASTPRRFILVSSFKCPTAQPACNYQNAVLKYDADTGEFLGPLIPFVDGPRGLAIHPIRETLLVASRPADTVNEYNLETGEFIGTFVTAGSGGLKSPQGILFKADGNLLVTSTPSVGFLDRVNGVIEYNGNTGAFVKVFINGGPISPILPENCGNAHCIRGPVSMAINPVNGRLYITSEVNNKILEHNAVTGTYVGAISANTKLVSPAYILMRPVGTTRAGNFLVTTTYPNVSPSDPDSIIEFDHITRSVVTFSPGSRDFISGITQPGPMMWLHDGMLLHDDRSNLNSSPNFADRLVIRDPLLGTFIANKTASNDTNTRTGTGLLAVAEGFASGDNDNDGDRDMKDFAAFMRCFGRTPSVACRNTFDDNLSGSIGLLDFRMFRRMFAGPPVPCSTNADCNDANPCTVGTCSGGDCFFAPVANGTSCSDGEFCNGQEACSNGLCLAAPPCADVAHCDEVNNQCLECLTHAECNDGNVCTTNTCVNNVCVSSNNTNACSDGNECTVNDRCSGGACLSGTPRSCSDGNLCTTDGCDPAIGCTFIHNTNPCNDGNACTVNDQCLLGTCRGGPPPVCDDGNPCTLNSCDPSTGCTFPPNNGIACDNGNACTTEDFCFNGVCQSGEPLDCDDEVPCTFDTCDNGECFHTPVDALCDDGEFCTGTGTCDPVLNCIFSGNPCAPGAFCNEDQDRCDECQVNADCNDGVDCTIDECVDGVCFNTPDDQNCPDDGLFCTGPVSCDEVGGCVHNNPPCDGPCNESLDICGECTGDEDCDDGVSCTTDSCDTENSLCINTPVDGLCDDGVFCNGVETCNATSGCQAGTPVDCDDGVACTIDACDENAQDCTHTPDDGACDDGITCTIDTCDAIEGCFNTPDDGLCDDGQFCTGDGSCDPQQDCVFTGSPCLPGEFCNENQDRCDECEVDVDCSDGLFCTGVETCVDGVCVPGTPPGCDDGLDCTIDSCDTELDECVHTPDHGACDDGLFCTGEATCDVNDGCLLSGNPCEPDEFCNEDENRCDECEFDSDCDDGFACTTDACVNGVCVFTPDDNFCSDGQFCNGAETCNPSDQNADAAGCVNGADPICDDGLECTIDFCNTASNMCDATPVDSLCNDGNPCTDNVCTVGVGCEFIPNSNSCNDGDPCTTDDVCFESACVGDSVDCSHLDDACNVGVCDELGQCIAEPANEGGSCGPGTQCSEDLCENGACIPVDLPDGTMCNDGDPCTDLDECQSRCLRRNAGGLHGLQRSVQHRRLQRDHRRLRISTDQ
jgi:hypothetical protein